GYCAVTPRAVRISFFLIADLAPTERYPLSLRDALPISELPLQDGHLGCAVAYVRRQPAAAGSHAEAGLDERIGGDRPVRLRPDEDRKSTRLNSSHVKISYAVFCLKRKRRTPMGFSYRYL